MKILAIDTSSNICSACILENEKKVYKIELNDGKTHSEKLMPIIKQLLEITNLSLKDIDLLVCDIGPGSFTGIRIGVATAKAFADSLNIQSIGISSLESLAYNSKNDGLICSIIDCKNNNCYFGLYKKSGTTIKILQKPQAESLDNTIDILKKNTSLPITFIGDGAITYRDLLQKSFVDCSFVEDHLNYIDCYNLGIAGYRNFNTNYNHSDNLLPLYLKKPQAEKQWEEKHNACTNI